MYITGLLFLVFWILTPLYLGGLIFYYRRKKKWPGLVGWIVNSLVAVLWLGSIILIVTTPDYMASSTDQTVVNNPMPSDRSTANLPGWDPKADGKTWLQDTEAQKQQFCTSAATASANHHTASFFYTNINAHYDPDNVGTLFQPLISLFSELDAINPNDSYPSFLGYSWKRMNLVSTPKGNVQMIAVFWQDGRTYMHSQIPGSDGTFIEAGLDGPWDGDAYLDTGTTTVSGNTFTIETKTPVPSTQSGTYQVSADLQELDLQEDSRPPARYTKVSQLVNSIDDL